MKKTTTLCVAAMAVLALSGCKDASVDISNGNEVLFTVGSTKVTNDDIFRPIFLGSGYAEVSYEVSNIVYEKEVPLDDAMETEAKEAFEKSKSDMGENFTSMLKQYGFKDEDDYYKHTTLPSVQGKALAKKYLEANAEDQIATYKPVKARIIACTSEENAKNALAAVQDGQDFEEVATEYGKTDTYTGAEMIVHQSSGLPSVVWSKISVVSDKESMINEVITDSTTNAESPTYYVVKVTNTSALDEFKDEALASILEKSTTIKKDAMKHYLEEYNFHVYDIDIYNSYKSQNPDYLVQDTKD